MGDDRRSSVPKVPVALFYFAGRRRPKARSRATKQPHLSGAGITLWGRRQVLLALLSTNLEATSRAMHRLSTDRAAGILTHRSDRRDQSGGHLQG